MKLSNEILDTRPWSIKFPTLTHTRSIADNRGQCVGGSSNRRHSISQTSCFGEEIVHDVGGPLGTPFAFVAREPFYAN